MADSNPANFANLPKDQLKEIAAKGGHASHGGGASTKEEVCRMIRHHLFNFPQPCPLTPVQSHPDRNPDGTFTKGSDLAKELGAKGGHASHEHQAEKDGASTIYHRAGKLY